MDECCVYWIRLPEHTDIFTEGYVGISNNFEYRLKQHIYFSSKPEYFKNYRTEFRSALSSGNHIARKILIGTRKYCMDVEERLRPAWKIGWNIAAGGSGGYGTHGLTGTKLKGMYYNLLSRAELDNEFVCEAWLGKCGLENFAEFYKKWEGVEGDFTLKSRGEGYTPENLIKMTRSSLVRRAYGVYDISDGNLYSIEELAEKFEMPPNRISNRLRNGWTIQEAVGLVKRKEKLMCLDSGHCVKYNGKLCKEEIEKLRLAYESGIPTTDRIAYQGIDAAAISRLARKFKFDTASRTLKLTCFTGEVVEVNLRSKLTQEFIEEFKALVMAGHGNSYISGVLDIPQRKVYYLSDLLKWREYEESVGNPKLPLEG